MVYTGEDLIISRLNIHILRSFYQRLFMAASFGIICFRNISVCLRSLTALASSSCSLFLSHKHLPNDNRVKEVFLRRLFNFNTSGKLKYGFIPDIYRILGKYSLIDAFDKYINTGVFECKFLSKRLVREKIRMAHENEWRTREEHSVSLNRFLSIHEHNKVYTLWELSKKYPKYARVAQNAVCMLA